MNSDHAPLPNNGLVTDGWVRCAHPPAAQPIVRQTGVVFRMSQQRHADLGCRLGRLPRPGRGHESGPAARYSSER